MNDTQHNHASHGNEDEDKHEHDTSQEQEQWIENAQEDVEKNIKQVTKKFQWLKNYDLFKQPVKILLNR